MFLCNLSFVSGSELSLDRIDFIKLTLGLGKLSLGLGERYSFYFEHMELGFYNLRLFVVVTHSGSPRTQAIQSSRCLLGDFGVEELFVWIVGRRKSEVGLE